MTTEIRSLRCLIVLAKRLNYSRAADELGLSQPALSRTIQNLERQLNLRLFDRDRSGVRPTPQGRMFIEKAAILVADLDDMVRKAQLAASGEAGIVRIGMAPLTAHALLSPTLGERLAISPNVSNEVVVRNVDALLPMLMADEIEFFVSAEGQLPDNPIIRSELLGYFPISLLVRSGHPLTSGSCPDQRFPVLLSSRRGLAGEMPADLRDYMSGTVHVVEDYWTLRSLLQVSDAIWLSSSYAVADELEKGMLQELQRPDEERQQGRMLIYSLERRTPSPAALVLKDSLLRQIRRLAARLNR